VRVCGRGVGAQHVPQLPAVMRDPRGVRRGARRGCAAVGVPRAGGCGGRMGAFGRGHVSGAGAHGWPAWGSPRVVIDATCALRVGGATGRGCWAGELAGPTLRVGSRGGVWWELPPARRCSGRWCASVEGVWVVTMGGESKFRPVQHVRKGLGVVVVVAFQFAGWGDPSPPPRPAGSRSAFPLYVPRTRAFTKALSFPPPLHRPDATPPLPH
jgi:hypothetical protein